jgi:hypothetical protein
MVQCVPCSLVVVASLLRRRRQRQPTRLLRFVVVDAMLPPLQ